MIPAPRISFQEGKSPKNAQANKIVKTGVNKENKVEIETGIHLKEYFCKILERLGPEAAETKAKGKIFEFKSSISRKFPGKEIKIIAPNNKRSIFKSIGSMWWMNFFMRT